MLATENVNAKDEDDVWNVHEGEETEWRDMNEGSRIVDANRPMEYEECRQNLQSRFASIGRKLPPGTNQSKVV